MDDRPMIIAKRKSDGSTALVMWVEEARGVYFGPGVDVSVTYNTGDYQIIKH